MTRALVAGISWEAIEQETAALVSHAADDGITMRVVGSTGIRMHCPQAAAAMDAVGRAPKDIDVVVRHADRGRLRDWLEARGWVVDRDVLVAMEGERFAFCHASTGMDLDVFVERLQFCHTIELGDRWEIERTTLPIEDLLLQKLQVHELKPSDAIDAAIVLATHDVGEGGDDLELIDGGYLAAVLARDWGFHRDASENLRQVGAAAGADGEAALPAGQAARVREGATRLLQTIDRAPKSMSWKMRARVGERMQWWDDVSEREDTY